MLILFFYRHGDRIDGRQREYEEEAVVKNDSLKRNK